MLEFYLVYDYAKTCRGVVKWQCVCSPMNEGCPSIFSFQGINESLLMSLAWKVLIGGKLSGLYQGSNVGIRIVNESSYS